MTWSAACCAVLGAVLVVIPVPAHTVDSARPQLLVMDLRADGVDDATARTITGLVTYELSRDPRVIVLSGADTQAMLDVETQRQQVTCADDSSSCLAEIAGALGARRVVYGQVGRLGQLKLIHLNIYQADSGRVLERVTLQSRSLDTLPDELRPALSKLMNAALPERAGAATANAAPSAPTDGAGTGPWPVVLLATGGGALLVGAVLGGVGLVPWFSYRSNQQKLIAFQDSHDQGLDASALEELADLGTATETDRQAWNGWGWPVTLAGAGVAGLGAGLAVAGALWWLSSESDEE